jgi:Flp pilus assembly protein TadD
VHQRAVTLLLEAAQKLPDNPTVQYHLGVASAKAGDPATARRALTAALASPASFPEKAEASKALAELR